MNARKVFAATIIPLMVIASLVAPATAEEDGATVAVLFDFGGGRWTWADVPVPEEANAACATEVAAEELGYTIDIVISQFGAFITAIDGVGSATDFSKYWGLLIWDSSTKAWEASPVGMSSLEVADGDHIAWQYAAFGDPAPDPTPRTREPFLEFRGGRQVQGEAGPVGPSESGFYWESNLGTGPIDSTPVVADGRVFVVTSGIFDWNLLEFVKRPAVVALDALTGDEIWRAPFDGRGGFEIGTPAYDGGVLYASTSSAHVMAVSASDGSVLWDVPVDEEGMSASPTVAGGKVIIGTGSGKAVALETATGEINWTANLTGWVYLQTPTVHDGRVYIGTDNHTLHALSLENGTEHWRVDLGGRVRGTALVVGDRLYTIAGVYRGFIPVDGRIHCLDLDGEERWNATIGPTGSSPALLGDHVLVGSQSGLYAFTKGGQQSWFFGDEGTVSSSPVVAGDVAYFQSNMNDSDFELHTSVLAIEEDGTVLWKRTIVPHNWALSSVAIADGRAYAAADNGWVYSIGDIPLEPDFEFTVDLVTVNFTDTTDGTKAAIVERRWELLDVEGPTEPQFEWGFPGEGDYNVTLTVTNELGRQASVTKTVTIELPTLDVGFNFTVKDGRVDLTASNLTPEISITEWVWSIEELGVTLMGAEASYKFDKSGEYNVTLKAIDEFDRQVTRWKLVDVDVKKEDDGLPGPGAVATIMALAIVVCLHFARRRNYGVS
jgi:outer membrane protein assembly factor BamB